MIPLRVIVANVCSQQVGFTVELEACKVFPIQVLGVVDVEPAPAAAAVIDGV